MRRFEPLDTRTSAVHNNALAFQSDPPRRILVKEVNWLGDLVMSLPALRAVRRAWPDAHLAVLVKKDLASFFDGAAWLDEVIPYSVGRGLSGFLDRRRIVGEIRRRKFDLGVLFPNSFESALWIAMAGIKRRGGFIVESRGARRAADTQSIAAARGIGSSPGELLAVDGSGDRSRRRQRERFCDRCARH